jgi:hypothetical protein
VSAAPPRLPSGTTYDYPHAPAELIDALRGWGAGEPGYLNPGGLVTALLENDLFHAVQVLHRSLGIDALRDLCWYCSMELPSAAWGSAEAVQRWREQQTQAAERARCEAADARA